MLIRTVLEDGFGALQLNTKNIVSQGQTMSDFWLDELLAEVVAYHGAIQRLVARAPARKEGPGMLSLIRSIDHEVQSIVRMAGHLVQDQKHNPSVRDLGEIVALETHLERLRIKVGYLVDHISDFMSQEQLDDLAVDFSSERAELVRRVHTMAAGG